MTLEIGLVCAVLLAAIARAQHVASRGHVCSVHVVAHGPVIEALEGEELVDRLQCS